MGPKTRATVPWWRCPVAFSGTIWADHDGLRLENASHGTLLALSGCVFREHTSLEYELHDLHDSFSSLRLIQGDTSNSKLTIDISLFKRNDFAVIFSMYYRCSSILNEIHPTTIGDCELRRSTQQCNPESGGFAIWEPPVPKPYLQMLNPSELFADIVVVKELYPGHRQKEIEKNKQKPDGLWYGYWGVCFLYGTFFVLQDYLGYAWTGPFNYDDEVTKMHN
ncbi:beta-amyrin synthase [Artemisia annua]|uniref:Beta-amyrin synthase n=1 Tax=Artemisia annua TaxID=35608 RepID=A0A2U1KCI5_ARTAN|nr:beta-amyrin synthase [Artemisia annua]